MIRDLARIVECEAYSFMWALMGLVALGVWSMGPAKIEEPILEFGGFAAIYCACNGVGILIVWRIKEAAARRAKLAENGLADRAKG